MAVDKSTLIQNAQRFMARGQIDKAIEEWQKLVALTPQDGNLYNTIGDLYLKKNDTTRATEAFMLAATAFERAGFALKTIAVYKKVLKVDPNNLEVNLKLADLNAERGLTGNAIEDYLKVAKEYGRRGKVQEALEIYRKIANFDPNNTNIRLKLAELSLREKLVDEAIDEYMKVAQIFEQSNRGADAAGIYKKVLEINPKHAGARDAMKSGVTPAAAAKSLPTVAEVEQAIADGELDLANQKLGVLLMHEATNPNLLRLRGKVLLRKGELGPAWIDYRGLAEEAVRAGQVDGALALLKEYQQAAPTQAEALELYAKLLDKVGKTEEALPAYAAWLEVLINSSNPDEGELRETFGRMKAINPNSEFTKRYQERFEPAAQEAPAEIAEPVQLEPMQVDEVMEAVAQSPTAEPMALDEEADEPSAKPVVEPMAPEPSISVSRHVNLSQSRSREAAPPPPPPKEASISQTRHTGPSQSRGTEVPSAQAPGSKRPRPRDLPDYFAEAEVYLKYGLAGKAIEQFQTILSVDANNIEAHAKLRELYQLEGRLDEAVTHSVLLARLYHTRGQKEQAEQVMAEAREWNPADPRLQAAIDEQSQISAAAAGGAPAHQDAQPRAKQDLQEWLAEAEFYLQQGLDDQAHQLFTTIRQHYPQAPEVLAYFEGRPDQPAPANAERSRPGRQDAAGEEHSLSAKLAELFPGAFRGLNDEAPAGGNDRLAASVEGVIRAVEEGGQPLTPEGPDPHYSLGLAYKEMGLYAEARKEFEQALQMPAYRVDAALMAAGCHKAEGHPRQAVRQLQECLGWLQDNDPKWRTVACELAALYAEVGDQEQAVSQLEQVLAVQADYEPAVTLLKQVTASPTAKVKEKEKEPERPKAKPQVQTKAAARGKEVEAEEESAPEQKPAAPAAKDKEKEKRYRISYV